MIARSDNFFIVVFLEIYFLGVVALSTLKIGAYVNPLGI
jgi:hypothetical protein